MGMIPLGVEGIGGGGKGPTEMMITEVTMGREERAEEGEVNYNVDTQDNMLLGGSESFGATCCLV